MQDLPDFELGGVGRWILYQVRCRNATGRRHCCPLFKPGSFAFLTACLSKSRAHPALFLSHSCFSLAACALFLLLLPSVVGLSLRVCALLLPRFKFFLCAFLALILELICVFFFFWLLSFFSPLFLLLAFQDA